MLRNSHLVPYSLLLQQAQMCTYRVYFLVAVSLSQQGSHHGALKSFHHQSLCCFSAVLTGATTSDMVEHLSQGKELAFLELADER